MTTNQTKQSLIFLVCVAGFAILAWLSYHHMKDDTGTRFGAAAFIVAIFAVIAFVRLIRACKSKREQVRIKYIKNAEKASRFIEG